MKRRPTAERSRREGHRNDVPPQPTNAQPALSNGRAGHALHLLLMLAALAVSYLLPFELFLLSYAVLGPLHYLTEISWLHDRRYFLPNRYIALGLCVIALGAMFIADAFWLGIIVSGTFVACAIFALALPSRRLLISLGVSTAVFAFLAAIGTPFGLAWLLIPTLIHVSLFTLVFMTVGAIRSRSLAQYGLVAAYLTAITVLIVLPPSAAAVFPQLALAGRYYFGDVAPALGVVVGLPNLSFDGRIAGLLSFVYTYHYLNWFIKVDVIRWAAVPKTRMLAIVLASLAATALYFYDYRIGFMVLLLLSLTHVLLEFPLNSISLRQLGGALTKSFGGARAPT